MTKQWRQRWTAAQHRGRTIERQAGGLRLALIEVADGKPADGALLTIRAMREQLEIAERLVAQMGARDAGFDN